jgi:hypothetical protein
MVILKNILKKEDKILNDNKTLWEHLQKLYPDGLSLQNITIYNKKMQKLNIEDVINKKTKDVDFIFIIHPATGVEKLFLLIIAAVVVYFLIQLLMPEFNQEKVQGNTLPNIGEGQMRARPNASIPEIFGEIGVYPALFAPSVTYYNSSNSTQYIHSFAIIGQGHYDITNVLINEEDVRSALMNSKTKCITKKNFLNCFNTSQNSLNINKYYLNGTYTAEQMEQIFGDKFGYVQVKNINNVDLWTEQKCSDLTGSTGGGLAGLLDPAEDDLGLKTTNLIYISKKDTKIKSILINYSAPNGLYGQLVGKKGTSITTVTFKVAALLYWDNGRGSMEMFKAELLEVTGRTKTPIRKTMEVEIPTHMQEKDIYIKFRLLTNKKQALYSDCDTYLSENSHTRQGSLVINNVYAKYLDNKLYQFKDVTAIKTTIAATEKLNRFNNLKIKTIVKREGLNNLLDVFNYVAEQGRLPFLFNNVNINGTEKFDAAFYNKQNIYSAIKALSNANGLEIYPTLRGLEIKKFKTNQPVRAVFNSSNIKKGSLKLQFVTLNTINADGAECVYYTKTGIKKTVKYPSNCFKPKQVVLKGSTLQEDAEKMAAFVYNKLKWETGLNVTFTTSANGFAAEVGDKILVQNFNGFDEMFGSVAIEQVGKKVTILSSLPKVITDSDNYKLLFTRGEEVVTLSVANGNKNEIELAEDVQIPLGSNVIITRETSGFLECRVKSVKLKNKNEVEVNAVNYTDLPYNILNGA